MLVAGNMPSLICLQMENPSNAPIMDFVCALERPMRRSALEFGFVLEKYDCYRS